MAYRIAFATAAFRQLEKLEPEPRARLKGRIDLLAHDPRPHGVQKMGGSEPLYRIRVGDYRIIYQIHDNVLLVLVVKIGHRREVYR